MKPKEYPALEEAVEIGINSAWMHAHKHVDKPTEYEIKEAMVFDIMNAICERWDFEDSPPSTNTFILKIPKNTNGGQSMNVIKQMLNSKKWTTAIASIISLAAMDFYGVNLAPDTLNTILVLVVTIIGAEGVADAAGARASRKQSPPTELSNES